MKITDITTDWLIDLRNSTKVCGLCDSDLKKVHLDHIVPLNCGGLHIKNNVRYVCPPCNLHRSKGNYMREPKLKV